MFYAKESLSQVDHQIWQLRNVFWWYLLPFTISLSAFFIHVARNTTGTWWGAMLVAAPFGLFLYYLYRWIYRLNQQAVRQQLQPRQEHLQRIVTNLESDGGGDASEVDDLVELVSSLSAPDQNLAAKRYKGQPLKGADKTRPGAPAILVLVTILIISALAVAAVFSFVATANRSRRW